MNSFKVKVSWFSFVTTMLPDRQEEESPGKYVVSWVLAETQGIMMGMMAIAQHHFDKTHGRDRCQLVLEEEQAGVEEERTCRMVGMWQLGVWTRWEGALEKKISGDMSGRTPANQVLGQDILQCTFQSSAVIGLCACGLGWQPPRGQTRKQLEN